MMTPKEEEEYQKLKNDLHSVKRYFFVRQWKIDNGIEMSEDELMKSIAKAIKDMDDADKKK